MYTPEFIYTPCIIEQAYDSKVLPFIYVVICGKEYDECDRASREYFASSKTGVYGHGMASSKDDPFRTERTGLLGEMATGKVCHLPVNTEYVKGGDRQDFVICGVRENTKCATVFRHNVYITKRTERGVDLPLNHEIYIAAFVSEESRKDRMARIGLAGYILREDIPLRCEIVGGKARDMHLNWKVQFDVLEPITYLLEKHLKGKTL